MKSQILSIDGKKLKEIELPECFSGKIREDIIAKVLEAKKNKQPYAPSLVGGKQHSASGKIVHRRHVWKSQYGRGISRIPRKIMSKKGSQFNWIGAEIASTVGGRRAHPPKAISMSNKLKINKKELKLALISALSATTNEKYLQKKYQRLKDREIKNLPFIVESKIITLKVKELFDTLKKILTQELFEIALQKKSVRAGRGKMRGRKYKKNAGMLFVVGEKEKLKTTRFEVKHAKNLGVVDLAGGGAGRLTMYTENAIKDLEEKFKEKK